MGLIHTPRTIAAIARGFLHRRSLEKAPKGSAESILKGFDPSQPYVSKGRAGLLDADYLGHLNNAAYLTHAELARWEMSAYCGLLGHVYRQQSPMLITASCIRHRREIRPVFRKFDIETHFCGLDERNIFIMHKFRYPRSSGRNNRVRAQLVVRGVLVKNRGEVIDPRDFLKEAGTMDGSDDSFDDVIDRLSLPSITNSGTSSSSSSSMDNLLKKFMDMEDAMRQEAADDDETHEGL